MHSESATLVISGDVLGAITLLVLLYLSDLDIFPYANQLQFYWLNSYFISKDAMINWLPHKISLHKSLLISALVLPFIILAMPTLSLAVKCH